ncbi:MAG TPA: SMI1/KNR4 family protein [Longimicrobium sp.]|nr:SMI1/KNR4 family protein [Longimicrobium sp.]
MAEHDADPAPDDPITGILAAVRRQWAEEGISPGTPATPAELEAFEILHRVRLPDDVRAWFLTLNGVDLGKDGPMDGLYVTFWNLSQVRPVPDEVPDRHFPGAERHLVFADYLLWSDAYALRLPDEPGAPTPVVVLYAAAAPLQVAPSLTAFLQAWLDADASVLAPGVPRPPDTLASRLRRAAARLLPESTREVPPRLRNRRALSRTLSAFADQRARSRPELRGAGERVAVLRMRIDRQGVPDPDTPTLDESTHDPVLDAETLRVATTLRFRPARVGRRRVVVWVTLPITYRFR